MINFFIGLVSTAFVTLSPTPNFQSIQKDELGPKIKVGVSFGKKSADCDRRGICKVTVEVGWDFNKVVPGNGGVGFLESDPNSDQLILRLVKSTMSPDVISTHLRSGLLLEEDFQIDNNVLSEIGKSRYTIKSGQYQVVDSGSEIIVKL
jgi:hypothetical protein